MRSWLKSALCALVALLLGLAAGFALRSAIPPRNAALLFSQLTPSQSTSAPEGDRLSLVHCALNALDCIQKQDYAALAAYIHPGVGLTLSPTATVDPATNLVFSAEELVQAAESDKTYVWGTSASTSTPINLTVNDYFASYVWDRDYISSLHLSVDTPQASGNALDNLLEVYPDSHYVEFYSAASDGPSEWSTLRLAFQWDSGQWYLIGLVHSAWNL